MKLYILNCGQMITPDDNILAKFNTPLLRLVLPVPVYLLEHPTQGLILIDTGFCYPRLPEEMKAGIAWSPILQIKNQIASLGYDPEDVKHVLLSHLHFDHAGQIEDFPKAVFHLRKSEWDSARACPSPDYFPEDYMGAKDFRLSFVPENEDVDLFDDGTVFCLDTKGHSAGHQSFVIALPRTGKVLLSMDAAHLPAYFDSEDFFQDAWNPALCVQAIEKIQRVRKECALTILGHDPAMWAFVRRAPEYYD